MRRTLGTAVFAGMLGVTLFGIFLTPVFFYVIRGLVRGRAPVREPAAVATDGSSRATRGGNARPLRVLQRGTRNRVERMVTAAKEDGCITDPF